MRITRSDILSLTTEVTPHTIGPVMRESHRQSDLRIPTDTNVWQIWQSWPFFDSFLLSSSPSVHLPSPCFSSLEVCTRTLAPQGGQDLSSSESHSARPFFCPTQNTHQRARWSSMGGTCNSASPSWCPSSALWLTQTFPGFGSSSITPSPGAICLVGLGFPKWRLLAPGHLPVM